MEIETPCHLLVVLCKLKVSLNDEREKVLTKIPRGRIRIWILDPDPEGPKGGSGQIHIFHNQA